MSSTSTLTHRRRPRVIQRRTVLADGPLPGRGDEYAPDIFARQPTTGPALWRRAGVRTQLRHRPALLLLPDGRPARPRRSHWAGRPGHPHGRWPADGPG